MQHPCFRLKLFIILILLLLHLKNLTPKRIIIIMSQNNNDDNVVVVSPFAIGSDKNSTPVANFWRTYENMKGRIAGEERQQFKTRMFALSRDKPLLFTQLFSDDPRDY